MELMKGKTRMPLSHRKNISKPILDSDKFIRRAYMTQRTLLGRTSELQQPQIEGRLSNMGEEKPTCKTMIRHGLQRSYYKLKRKRGRTPIPDSQSLILLSSHGYGTNRKLANSKRKEIHLNLAKMKNFGNFSPLLKSADFAEEEKQGNEINTDIAAISLPRTSGCRTMRILAMKGDLDEEASKRKISESNEMPQSFRSHHLEPSQEKDLEEEFCPFGISPTPEEFSKEEKIDKPYLSWTPECSSIKTFNFFPTAPRQAIDTSLLELSLPPQKEIILTPRLGPPRLLSTTEIKEAYSEIPAINTTSGIGAISLTPSIKDSIQPYRSRLDTPSNSSHSGNLPCDISLNKSFNQSFHYKEEHRLSTQKKGKMIKKSGLEITIEENERPEAKPSLYSETYSNKTNSILKSITALETENAYLRSLYSNTLSAPSLPLRTLERSANQKVGIRNMLNLIIIFLLFFVVLLLLISGRK